MKYFALIVTLLIAGTTFSQSKKRKIEILQHQLDSISKVNQMLWFSQHEQEKLNRKTLGELTRETEMLRRITIGYVHDIDSLVSRVDELEKQNSILKREKSQLEDKGSGNSESSNQSTTNQISNNPFGDGGSAGSEGAGCCGPAPNLYSGTTNGKGRTRLNNVSVNDIQINQDATIYYKLTIDQNGNVVAFSHIKSKTTTTNMTLINKLGAAIKKQVKYNKVPDAPLTYQFYTIHIKPT